MSKFVSPISDQIKNSRDGLNKNGKNIFRSERRSHHHTRNFQILMLEFSNSYAGIYNPKKFRSKFVFCDLVLTKTKKYEKTENLLGNMALVSN